MPISDFDIQRLAHLFTQLDGEYAIVKARNMVEEMRRKGDREGADKWLRIIVTMRFRVILGRLTTGGERPPRVCS